MKSWKEMAEKTGLSEDQLQKIEAIILKDNYFPAELVRQEIEAFCTGLGLPQQYFQTVPLEMIARHIEALKASQILAQVKEEKTLKIDLARESEEEALYLVEDNHYRALEIEERIEKTFCFWRAWRRFAACGGKASRRAAARWPFLWRWEPGRRACRPARCP